jgi:hypothetical protein
MLNPVYRYSLRGVCDSALRTLYFVSWLRRSGMSLVRFHWRPRKSREDSRNRHFGWRKQRNERRGNGLSSESYRLIADC